MAVFTLGPPCWRSKASPSKQGIYLLSQEACLICMLLPALPAPEAVLTPAFVELCYNLESFNPAFTSCLLQVGQGLATGRWG